MCTWCIHSWANLKYQDWFGKHCADPKCIKCYVLQNWNHISELSSKTRVRRTFYPQRIDSFCLSCLLTPLPFLEPIFCHFPEQRNSLYIFELLNLWSLCLWCLSKSLSMSSFLSRFIAFFWPSVHFALHHPGDIYPSKLEGHPEIMHILPCVAK